MTIYNRQRAPWLSIWSPVPHLFPSYLLELLTSVLPHFTLFLSLCFPLPYLPIYNQKTLLPIPHPPHLLSTFPHTHFIFFNTTSATCFAFSFGFTFPPVIQHFVFFSLAYWSYCYFLITPQLFFLSPSLHFMFYFSIPKSTHFHHKLILRIPSYFFTQLIFIFSFSCVHFHYYPNYCLSFSLPIHHPHVTTFIFLHL